MLSQVTHVICLIHMRLVTSVTIIFTYIQSLNNKKITHKNFTPQTLLNYTQKEFIPRTINQTGSTYSPWYIIVFNVGLWLIIILSYSE